MRVLLQYADLLYRDKVYFCILCVIVTRTVWSSDWFCIDVLYTVYCDFF